MVHPYQRHRRRPPTQVALGVFGRVKREEGGQKLDKLHAVDRDSLMRQEKYTNTEHECFGIRRKLRRISGPSTRGGVPDMSESESTMYLHCSSPFISPTSSSRSINRSPEGSNSLCGDPSLTRPGPAPGTEKCAFISMHSRRNFIISMEQRKR